MNNYLCFTLCKNKSKRITLIFIFIWFLVIKHQAFPKIEQAKNLTSKVFSSSSGLFVNRKMSVVPSTFLAF